MEKKYKELSFEECSRAPFEGCDCLFASESSPYHKHKDFYEISLVTCGSYTNEYKEERTLLTKGSLTFYAVGEKHALYEKGDANIHFSFIMTPEAYVKFAGKYGYKRELDSKKHIVRHLNHVQGEYLIMLANNIVENHGSSMMSTYVQMFLFNAMSLFCVKVPDVKKSVNKYAEDLETKLNNFEYLDKSVNEICRIYPLAQCTLINGFKDRTGYTIIQYVSKKRMEYAAQLLTLNDYSITEISNMLNISSISYFIRLFKNYFGVTPFSYRKTHQRLRQDGDELS